MIERFNRYSPVIIGDPIDPPTDEDLDSVFCVKYASFNYAYRNNSRYVRNILEKIPMFSRHLRILIDIKVHNLEIGDVPCVPGWHLDGSINPKNLPKKPEIFTLFVTGTGCLTEFLANPIDLEVDPCWDFAKKSNMCGTKIPNSHPVMSIPSCTFVSYSDKHFHRGAIAKKKERRLLIRTTETDIIQYRDSRYDPMQTKVITA